MEPIGPSASKKELTARPEREKKPARRGVGGDADESSSATLLPAPDRAAKRTSAGPASSAAPSPLQVGREAGGTKPGTESKPPLFNRATGYKLAQPIVRRDGSDLAPPIGGGSYLSSRNSCLSLRQSSRPSHGFAAPILDFGAGNAPPHAGLGGTAREQGAAEHGSGAGELAQQKLGYISEEEGLPNRFDLLRARALCRPDALYMETLKRTLDLTASPASPRRVR